MKLCARCRRPLSRAPIVVGGKGYGPTCAALVGDLATPATTRAAVTTGARRKRKGDDRQLALEVTP